MYSRRPSQRRSAAQEPPRNQRGGKDNTTRTEKKSMGESDQLALAEDLETIQASFLDQIGNNPSDKDVEEALKDIEHDNRAWLKELHAKSLSHHEPLHIIVDSLFAGDLEPELASLLIGQEGRLREVDAFLQIGDHVGQLPASSYRADKLEYLMSLDPSTVEHFEGPREDARPKRQQVKGIANRIKARNQQQDTRREWGPVHVAFQAVVGRDGMTWDQYRDHVEGNQPSRKSGTRPSAPRKDDSDDTPAQRPSDRAKTKAKQDERPSRKARTPEPAQRPSAKAKANPDKAPAKPGARPSARTRKAPAKPNLDTESKALVAKLRKANSGNEAIANSIANALEAGEYTLVEAVDKASEAGIKLDAKKAAKS